MNYYKTEYVTCSSCGDKGYYPIPYAWWNKHTSAWHTLKCWYKRKMKR